MIDSQVLHRLREIAEERTPRGSAAHDFSHVLRVTENARLIGREEGARLEILLPAAFLHELFAYPKDHPDSPRSGEACAGLAAEVLRTLAAFTEEEIGAVALCIRDHPFSLGRVPETLEGKALQDADRLDAIGAVGIARCFATCGELKRPLFHPTDPFCETRPPADRAYGLDHFYGKLLKIEAGLHTVAARALAAERTGFLRSFIDQLRVELGRTGNVESIGTPRERVKAGSDDRGAPPEARDR